MNLTATRRAVAWHAWVLSLSTLFWVPFVGQVAAAADFGFTAPRSLADPEVAATMRDLAERLLPVYQEADQARYLDTLSALQMVAGSYAAADASRQSLRQRTSKPDSRRSIGRGVIFDIYDEAKARASQERGPFADSFEKSFRQVVPRLTDLQAYQLTAWLATPPADFRQALQNGFDRLRQQKKNAISESDATQLIWSYLSFEAYRELAPLIAHLEAEEQGRRYVANETVVMTPHDGRLAVRIVRPLSSDKPLPVLFEFSNDARTALKAGTASDFAQESAAHGYVGVVVHARTAAERPANTAPLELDGADARAIVNWLAMQPWSDGRVGMYGEGLGGFVAWSVAQGVPVALRAFATSGASAPGIDFPMEGNIALNAGFAWAPKDGPVTRRSPPIAGSALDQRWYRSGRRYRDLGRLAGRSSRTFIRWLNHPSYDRYWQKFIPYRQQFASVGIPVLTITGFYAASEPAAVYYFRQHTRYNPQADHTLLIGPYDDATLRDNPASQLHRLHLDASAIVNLHDLRFQWFDHVFKEAAVPALLADRVNYQVAASDEWRHAPTLSAIDNGKVRLYLGATAARDGRHSLQETAAEKNTTDQSVSYTDRRDVDWTAATELVTQVPETRNGIVFESAPLKQAAELAGAFSGHLDFTVNKMDVDLSLMLYERSEGGVYTRLLNPAYQFRASYARDRAHRHLLKAGERQGLDFQSERLIGRRLPAGSRLVLVLSVQKRPDQEINYGTGEDVSAESIANAKPALRLRWYADSYLDLPVRR